VDVRSDAAAAHLGDQLHGAPQLLVGPALRNAGGVPANGMQPQSAGADTDRLTANGTMAGDDALSRWLQHC
jgi:hypothetical protein